MHAFPEIDNILPHFSDKPCHLCVLFRKRVVKNEMSAHLVEDFEKHVFHQIVKEMYLFWLSYLLIFHYDHILPDVVIQ